MPRTVPAWALNDALHCTTSGFRPRAWNSAASKLRANQPRSSPSSSSSMTQAPGSGVWLNRITRPRSAWRARTRAGPRARSREQRQLRRARGETPAPLADEAELLDDLLLEVPGKDQHDVGLVFKDRLRRADRYVAPRQEVSLLVWVQVAGVVDEVPTHAAVVEQRVALRRRAVADDAQALLLEVDQEAEDLALVSLDPATVAK